MTLSNGLLMLTIFPGELGGSDVRRRFAGGCGEGCLQPRLHRNS